ncbi:AMP-binding protein [Pseudomonas sp. PCH446]
MVPYDISRSPAALRQWLSDQRVTVLSQTPSAFRGLDEADRGVNAPLALRYVVFGGEALPATVLRPWVERHGDQKPALINMYGLPKRRCTVPSSAYWARTWKPARQCPSANRWTAGACICSMQTR